MGINKFIYFGETKFDLSADTAEAENVEKGYTFHNKAGNLVTGTFVKPSGSKTITSNGTYDVKSVESAIVNVPIPDGYVKPSGTTTLTSNGSTYSVKNYEYAKVSVPTQIKTVTPDTLTQEVMPDEGKLLSSVTVAAIPSTYVKPSGTLPVAITSPIAATYSVKNYESVEITPSIQDKRVTITSNGTTSIGRDNGYAGMDTVYVTVNVPTSSSPTYKSSVITIDINPIIAIGWDCYITAYVSNSGHPEYWSGWGLDVWNDSIFGNGLGVLTIPIVYDEDSGHCYPITLTLKAYDNNYVTTFTEYDMTSGIAFDDIAANTMIIYATTYNVTGTFSFKCEEFKINN